MNRKQLILFYIVILSIFFSADTNAQNANQKQFDNTQPAIGSIFYDFRYLSNTAQPDNFSTETIELDFGKTESLFLSYTQKLKDAAMQKIFQARSKSTPVDEQTINQAGAYASKDEFYTTLKQPVEVWQLLYIMTSAFIIKDTERNIDWTILDSTKNIQGNLCQKAIGESHGRTYTAWFCADLPYSFGPRRLNGLPGLILEAYDDKHEVVYTLNRIEKNIPQSSFIGLPKDVTITTAQQFKKAQYAYAQNPAKYWNANSGSIKVVNGKSTDPAIKAKIEKLKLTANPIDLK